MWLHQRMLTCKLLLCFSYWLVLMHAQAETLTYTGSSAIAQFIEDASDVYEGSTFIIDTLPESSGGEICSYRGKCDLGGVARSVNDRYLDKGVVATLIGYDAIAVIVHKNNYVEELTSCQLSGIFSGNINNWSEVGGPDRPIKVYIPKETSGAYKVFKEDILRHQEYIDVKKISPDKKIISKVASSEAAIGQISLALIQGDKNVKSLVIDGEACNVKNSTYPITRPMYLLTKDAPKGEVKSFIDWTISPAGQDVVKKRFIGNK